MFDTVHLIGFCLIRSKVRVPDISIDPTYLILPGVPSSNIINPENEYLSDEHKTKIMTMTVIVGLVTLLKVSKVYFQNTRPGLYPQRDSVEYLL